MNRLLEELRAQRQLIQQHLEWLEQQIARLKHEAPDVTKSAAGRPAQPKMPHLQPPPTETARAIARGETNGQQEQPSARPPGAVPADQTNDPFTGFASPAAPSGDPIRQAKIGCLVLFVLASGLFLFLLFGVPYLLE